MNENILDDMRNLNLPRIYEALRVKSKANLEDIFFAIFSYEWEGVKQFEKSVLRWLIVHYPLHLINHMENIVICGNWKDIVELLFDTKNLKNEFSTSFCSEKLREAQKEVASYIAWRLKSDYTIMTLGKVNCSDCCLYIPLKNSSVAKGICAMMGVTMKELRKEYVIPLRAYVKLIRSDYKNWLKVPHSAIRRFYINQLE
jgi:hypothetical protein